jgi:hypothetical protein
MITNLVGNDSNVLVGLGLIAPGIVILLVVGLVRFWRSHPRSRY